MYKFLKKNLSLFYFWMVKLALALSIIALLATVYQLYLQRNHNEKSVKPLAQIDLMDKEGVLFVHVQNNGIGPMTVDRLIFTKGNESYARIQDCMDIGPRTYNHVEITASNKKVIVPGGFLEVFSRTFDLENPKSDLKLFQEQLAALHIKVDGHDIYDNRISVEKSLKWFARHH